LIGVQTHRQTDTKNQSFHLHQFTTFTLAKKISDWSNHKPTLRLLVHCTIRSSYECNESRAMAMACI